MPPKPRKKWIVRLAEGVALLALTAILTEVAFRLVHQIHPIYVFPSATYDRFRIKPGALVHGFPVSSGGFMDVEPEARKGAGSYRILGLGDSFVFGVVPYPNNFLRVLEEELRATRPSIEILNMGIPDTDTGDYLLLLRKEGLRLDPDLVIVHFFIGNDFFLRTPDSVAPSSYLVAFLRYAAGIAPRLDRELARGSRSYSDDAPTFRNQETYLRILRRRLGLFRKRNPSYLEAFARVASNLAEIREECRRHGARLLVVVLPEEMQVSWEARRLLISSLPGYQPRRFDYTLPNAALHEELERQGIAYLDLYPAFRAAGADTVLYKPRDTHWNIRGNRLAAAVMRDYLLAGDWLASDQARSP